jgi:hypothetical protein
MSRSLGTGPEASGDIVTGAACLAGHCGAGALATSGITTGPDGPVALVAPGAVLAE